MRKRTYVIPKNDREIFIDPPIDRVPELIHSNSSKFSTYNFNICGIPFQRFRSMARRELLQKAIEYTKQICPNNPPSPPFNKGGKGGFGETIIQTGYQPTFYHPGIWIKNHLAYHIARRVNGTSINISIDNDVCHENWICVPSSLEREDKMGRPATTMGEPETTMERIEFVESDPNLPFEELSISDNNKVRCFKDKVLTCLNRLALSKANVTGLGDVGGSGGSVTFEKFANLMIDASKKTSNLGEILTISRRKFEDCFGIYNLEVPVSKICDNDSFLIFFLSILLHCLRFANIYNHKLQCYRKVNKLRSKAHPLPDLKVDGNTVELPFWAWRQGEPRKKLFVQCVDNKHINLIYENQAALNFDTGNAVGLDAQLARLKELVNSGFKIRPRAIIITMYSRLFLSDLFIHGIGGARYDVITDALIKDFFGVEPPNFLTTSATLHLPYNPPCSHFNEGVKRGITEADLNAQRLLLRNMHYNPEKYLSPQLKTNKEIGMLIMEKQKIIKAAGERSHEQQSHEERSHKFKRIREINSLIEAKLLPYINHEKRELERMERLVLHNEIIRNRTYPFCIYPESLLKDFYGPHSLLPDW